MVLGAASLRAQVLPRWAVPWAEVPCLARGKHLRRLPFVSFGELFSRHCISPS